jgi:DNA-binding transcriptional LysR family regulator
MTSRHGSSYVEILSSGLKLRHLQVLRQVMKAGSERSAGRDLRISQPAVSQNLRQLEAIVGFPLFIRENNRLVATTQAHELLRSVDTAFAGLDRLGRVVDGIRNSDRKIVTIAAPSAFCLRLLPSVAVAVRSNKAGQAFSIRTGAYDELADHVHHGRADIALTRLPLDDRLYDCRPLGTAANVCLFPKGHRFHERNILTPDDLVGEPLVDIDPQFASHQMNVNALRFMGETPEVAVEYDAHGHDAGFVAAGLGVSITNDLVAREYQRFELLSRPFEPSAIYHYVIAWQKERQPDGAVQRTIDALIRAVEENGRLDT